MDRLLTQPQLPEGIPVDERAAAQLEVIREIDEILGRLPARCWLRGGWAIDFLLGRVTRSHADIDLVTWQRHRARIDRALQEAEFMRERELVAQTDYINDGQEISFVYLEQDADGAIIAHGMPAWIWEPAALPARKHTLLGAAARVVSPAHLLSDLEGYEQATGRPLRPKDFGTREILWRLTGGGGAG